MIEKKITSLVSHLMPRRSRNSTVSGLPWTKISATVLRWCRRFRNCWTASPSRKAPKIPRGHPWAPSVHISTLVTRWKSLKSLKSSTVPKSKISKAPCSSFTLEMRMCLRWACLDMPWLQQLEKKDEKGWKKVLCKTFHLTCSDHPCYHGFSWIFHEINHPATRVPPWLSLLAIDIPVSPFFTHKFDVLFPIFLPQPRGGTMAAAGGYAEGSGTQHPVDGEHPGDGGFMVSQLC